MNLSIFQHQWDPRACKSAQNARLEWSVGEEEGVGCVGGCVGRGMTGETLKSFAQS